MLENMTPKQGSIDLTLPLKLMAFAAVGLLVGLGLCGVNFLFHTLSGVLAVIGAGILSLSVLALVVGIVWLSIAVLLKIVRGR